jgi:hypothetical protein
LWILTMAPSSTTTFAGRLMTLKAIVSRIRSITTTLATTTWSFQDMYISTCNEILDVRVYHFFLHTTCPLFLWHIGWCCVWLSVDLWMGKELSAC